ncbi:hypothetical protein DAPPUDRAFT_259726 [Daphnia pulex]|uniref:Uncharacterized protein n=1 Tax=Daphnia pulex TaxID=6669 RepID=E9HHR6_DAPPU|nr:hypothetical protein DAPPUDRAFT_259726 [Daphnia pulex]|eukprot:EFX68675.1 hypothetical protein DAPPUDRAFT_259726 [Daphnia pulex]
MEFMDFMGRNYADDERAALRHGNSTKTTNYQRLEVIEDAALASRIDPISPILQLEKMGNARSVYLLNLFKMAAPKSV